MKTPFRQASGTQQPAASDSADHAGWGWLRAVLAGIWLGRGAGSDGSPVREDGAAELTVHGGAASAAALEAG